MRMLIAGASGFIGKNALQYYRGKYSLKTVSYRKKSPSNLDFKEIDIVLFFTGIAHALDQLDSDIYFKINRDLAVECSSKAKENNVKHFIYLSSTKVYGDKNYQYLDESSPLKAKDAYGLSKKEAEKLLMEHQDENYQMSIIRPCLVYGKGVKGNLNNLIELINKTPILPLGSIENKRSMVNVKNVLSLIDKIIEKRTSGIYLATDLEPYSTTKLIETIAKVKDKSLYNFRLPTIFLRLIKRAKPQIYSRLFESYYINSEATNKALSFVPKYTLEEGLKEMIKK